MAMQKVIYYLIPLIFLVIAAMMLFGPENLFSGVKDAVNTVGEYAPDVNIGMNELNAGTPTVQEEVLSGFKQIIKDIERMRDSPNKDCFVRSKLGPIGKNAKITFNKYNDDTEVFIMGGAGGKQEVEKIVIEGVTPCVIGWKYKNEEYSVARNFFEKILKGNEISSEEHYFMELDSIVLYQKKEGAANNIIYGPYDTYVSNAEWMYSPDGKHFCFFPTDDSNGGCEVDYGDKDGKAYLDDDCLDSVNDKVRESLYRKLHLGALNYCNSASLWTRVNWIEIYGNVDQTEDKDKVIRGACLVNVGTTTTCPTQDNNCNQLRSEPQENKGCSIIASEYDGSGNDCADGYAPIGKIIPSSTFVSLLDITNTKESSDDLDAVRLFDEHDWSGGKKSYICHESGYWYECNLAQKGSILEVYNESYKCDGDEYYEWTHFSGSGDNLILDKKITKCEDYESEKDCNSDLRKVANHEIELCSWDASSCTTISTNYDVSEPVVVEGSSDGEINPFIECGFDTNNNCGAGEECVNGICMKSCSGGCEEGSKCIEGTCKKSCESDNDCDTYYTCVESLLYYDLKSCAIKVENDYCPDLLVAYNGACVKPLCTMFYFDEVNTDYSYSIGLSSGGMNYISDKTTNEVVLSGYLDYNEEYLTGVHKYIQEFYDKIPEYDAKEEAQKCFPIKVGESKEVVIKAWQYDEEVASTKLLVPGKDGNGNVVSISCTINNNNLECKQS